MGTVLPFVPKDPKCRWCGGKPDEVYFIGSTGEVLEIICDACKAGFEAIFMGLGGNLCTEPDCEQCRRNQTQWI